MELLELAVLDVVAQEFRLSAGQVALHKRRKRAAAEADGRVAPQPARLSMVSTAGARNAYGS